MFKFVLCAVLAVVVAEPGILSAPLGYSETYVAPATTTITRQASSVVNAPYYSAYPYGVAHFIKKRSVPLVGTYVAPSTYVSGSWASPYLSSNGFLPYSSIQYPHLIKKRSAAFIAPGSYFAPASYASTYYPASPFATTYSSALLDVPLAHSIKKRSAAWVAPAAIGSSYFTSAPLAYSSAILPSTPYWTSYSAALPWFKK